MFLQFFLVVVAGQNFIILSSRQRGLVSLSFTIKNCVDLTKSHREHRTIQRHHWSRSTWLKNPNLIWGAAPVSLKRHMKETPTAPPPPLPPPLFSSPTCPTVRPHQYPDPCYPPPPAVGVDLLWCNYYLLLVEPGSRNSRKVNQSLGCGWGCRHADR